MALEFCISRCSRIKKKTSLLVRDCAFRVRFLFQGGFSMIERQIHPNQPIHWRHYQQYQTQEEVGQMKKVMLRHS